MEEFICKIADLDELIRKADYEIARNSDEPVWEDFKRNAVRNHLNGSAVLYIGILNGEIICEATAYLNDAAFEGDLTQFDGLIREDMVYLAGFRTNAPYRGQGYFSRLLEYMKADLKRQGYKRMSLGVGPENVRAIQLYFRKGFTNYIMTTYESGGDAGWINFYYADIE